jgi:serine/threonine protein phosphatase PrpC
VVTPATPEPSKLPSLTLITTTLALVVSPDLNKRVRFKFLITLLELAHLEVTPLNRDHKPELKDEAERIHKRGGRIDSFRDYYNGGEPIGPQRVWLAHEEVPGLAMSRSMGDKVAHSVGVTAEPETWEFTLGLHDRYLVIASDGVWEFLSNEDVAGIVYPFYEQNAPEAAANALVKAAFKKWKQEEEVIDDITVVIIFLEPSMAYNSLRKSHAGSLAVSSGSGKP